MIPQKLLSLEAARVSKESDEDRAVVVAAGITVFEALKAL